jgi:hypothetical protein
VHEEATALVAHQIGAADIGPDPKGGRDADALGAKIFRLRQHLGREHAVGDDALPVVDIVDEAVERTQALLEAGLHLAPLARGDGARNDVEGPGAVDVALLGIDREGHPKLADGGLRHAPPRLDLGVAERRQAGHQAPCRGPRVTGTADQLVEETAAVVLRPVQRHVAAPHRRRPSLAPRERYYLTIRLTIRCPVAAPQGSRRRTVADVARQAVFHGSSSAPGSDSGRNLRANRKRGH